MSKVDFVETYLREIGVQTPVSLVRFGNKKSNAKQVSSQILGNVSLPESELKSVPVNDLDLPSMAEQARQCQ